MKKIRLKVVEIAKRYLSGKLIVVQFLGGCSAFIFRTSVAYFTTYKFHLSVWDTAVFYTIASDFGYIATWFIGYFIAFRKDYYRLKRPIWPDMLRLQLIEQAPNLITLVPSALSGWALTSEAGISPLASTNITSWFGPQKILNLSAGFISQATKKAWVDKTWKPGSIARRILRRERES
jgi:membrane protein YqaA with SNARE-associated domain